MITTDKVASILAKDKRRKLLYIARNLLANSLDADNIVPRQLTKDLINKIDKEINIEELR